MQLFRYVHLIRFISNWFHKKRETQLTFTCSKLTIETLEKGGKYVQS